MAYIRVSYYIITILRRIMCLSALGNYDSCLEVINTSITEHGQLADLLIMRARINYMFGNVSSYGCHGDYDISICIVESVLL